MLTRRGLDGSTDYNTRTGLGAVPSKRGTLNEIERYVALANLKKLEVYEKMWPWAYKDFHVEEMWHIIRALAVLDWTLMQPEHGVTNAEERFKTIMRNVQKLALQIQEEQGGIDPPPVN